MANYKLTIPKPCHESWDTMIPNAQGRFCGQCQKTVTDFTGMTAEKINAYLEINSDKKVCGKFNRQQLSPFVLHIPETVLYTQTGFKKVFMLALLITMGATLFSCKDHNNVVGEIVIDTPIQIDTINYEKGEQIMRKAENPDSLIKAGKKILPPLPAKKYEPQTLLGEPSIVQDTVTNSK